MKRCDYVSTPGSRSEHLLLIKKLITESEWSHDARTFYSI